MMQALLVIKSFLLILFGLAFGQSDECKNATCTVPLDCHPPNTKIILPDPEDPVCCNITECICQGTGQRFSFSGSNEEHYRRLSAKYANCTMIEGNLEIVHIHSNISSLEFAKHIRSVTGYVLIGMNFVSNINLSSLRLIRGETLFDEQQSRQRTCKLVEADNSNAYALFIKSNQDESSKRGLETIDLSSLTEIKNGNVGIIQNRNLCFVDTIMWEGEIFEKDGQSATIENNSNTCSKCDSSCVTEGVDDVERCWGPGENLCQKYSLKPCSICSGHRCTVSKHKDDRRCCSQDCAGGCSQLGSEKCYFCDNLNNFGECMTNCPTGEESNNHNFVANVDKKKLRYKFSRFCVKECPYNIRLLEKSRTCVLTCPENYHEKDRKCVECKGDDCAQICYGLDANLGHLKTHDSIHAGNIGNFTKNCTIIEGSLSFRLSSFTGDDHCNISAMPDEMLDVFENVEVITGSLNIEHWNRRDLSLFKNLRQIRGLQKRHDVYSLVIHTDDKILREMSLNSLEEISTGNVLVYNNQRLCHVSNVSWSSVLKDPGAQRAVVMLNKDNCRACHSNCKVGDGCWGPGSDQCVTCKDKTDYTNKDGKFAGEWRIDPKTNLLVPDHNVTRCVRKCNVSKRVYATPDSKCFPCHEECVACVGPLSTNCTSLKPGAKHGCKHYLFEGNCTQSCTKSHYPDKDNICQKCSPGCENTGCKGPADEYSDDGCTICYKEYNTESNLVVYNGAACQVCLSKLKNLKCSKGCTYSNSTNEYACYDEPNNFWLIPLIVVIVILCVAIIVICVKCKEKMKKLGQRIGENLVADTVELDEFNTPLSPTGTAPNRARLRIVKDDELCLGKELGSGAFGAVYKAIWSSFQIEGQTIKIPVAVKQLKTTQHSNEIIDEAYVMASVDSPYLIRLLGICISEKVSLITQLMPLGSLLEYVRNNTDDIGSRHMLTWCTQIAKGMQYLEEKHLVHRDLAARNVLLKTPHQAKITDFGLSKMLNASQSVYFAEGGKLPIKWLAIECIQQRQFSHQSDVWSFGVTCWEIFTFGARPYDGVRAVDVLSLLDRGDRLKQPPVCTIEVYMWLVKCWLCNPASRPKFYELVEQFSNMCQDHSRFIVIKNDPNNSLLSPNPEDERRFFERLIREDDMGLDDGLILDDPDTYLLSNQVNSEHEYENQPLVPRHSTNGNVGGIHESRLFSRNTPSAQMPTPQPQNSTANGFGRSLSRLRESDSSNPDDVFMNSGHGLPNVKTPLTVDMPIPEKPSDPHAVRFANPNSSVWQTRKDSDENSRYTEDPTTQNRNSYVEVTTPSADGVDSTLHHDNMRYDEEEYLLPTPSRNNNSHDLFDSKKSSPRKKQTQAPPVPEEVADSGVSLSNNAYLNSNEMGKSQQSHPSTWSNQFVPQKDDEMDPLYVNDEVPQHDYLNWNSVDVSETTAINPKVPDKKSQSDGLDNQQSTSNYANLNDMSTDISMNGRINPSTPNNIPHQIRSPGKSPLGAISNNGSLGRPPKSNNIMEGGPPSPEFDMISDQLSNDMDRSLSNGIGGLDNPEYMMLQNSSSEKQALLSQTAPED